MKKSKKFLKRLLYGGLIGSLNGLFGAGGGILCVPILISEGFTRKAAHKNTLGIILPITVVSAFSYLLQGSVTLMEAVKYIPGGILGSYLGTIIIKKLPKRLIKRFFGVFMLWAGWRLFT